MYCVCFCTSVQLCPTGPMQTCSPFPSRDLPLLPSPITQVPGEQVRSDLLTSRKRHVNINDNGSANIYYICFFHSGTSPSLSPVTSPSHSPPAVGMASSSSLVTRSPVEFPDTADFLTKPSVNLNLHKPLSYTLSSPDFQQSIRGSSFPLCTR